MLSKMKRVLRALLRRSEVERELNEELRYHVEQQTEQNIRLGMSPEEAHTAARKAFGGMEQAKERSRDVRGSRWLGELWQDLRYGVRLLKRQPGLTIIAILTMALGIGANTAIFSVVNALLLRPLPYRQPEQLVKVFQSRPDPAKGMLPSIWSYPRFEILRDQNQSFAAVAGFKESPYNLTGTDAPERLQLEFVSAGYFPMLGVEAMVGRAFTAEEERMPGANSVALLSYGLWQRRFGGDPQLIGKTIELDKQAFTIVGVLPPGFRGQSGAADVWTDRKSVV